MNDSLLEYLHGSQKVRQKLLQKGYQSSAHIFHESERRFMENVEGIMPENEAREVYKKAEINYGLLVHLAAAIQTASPRVKQVDDTHFFENIPNYQEIFGSMDYCSCSKCKSVFGPAAYFVDLMRIIGKHIVLEDRKWVKNQPVPLQERRKDLWTLILSCENTNQEIPYLQIVNKILEAYHGENDIYKTMQGQYHLGIRPFSLPLSRVRVWLKDQNLSPELFLSQWGLPKENVVMENLKLSPELYQMLEKPLEEAAIEKLLGISLDEIKKMEELPVFLRHMKMTQKELYALLEQDILEQEANRAKLLHGLFINCCLENDRFVEIKENKLINLSMQSLERMVRFTRLAQIFGVSFAEMEWMIRTQGQDAGKLNILELWKQWNLCIKLQTDACNGAVYTAPIKDYGDNLYYKIFNCTREEMRSRDSEKERLRLYADTFHTELGNVYILRDYLGEEAVVDEDAFYRHVAVARMLGIPMQEYTDVLVLLFAEHIRIYTPDKLDKLILFVKGKRLATQVFMQLRGLEKGSADKMQLNMDELHEKINHIRNTVGQMNQEALKAYVYTQLAEYFHVSDERNMQALFSCVLTEKERRQWTTHLLEDQTFDEIDQVIKRMYSFLLLYNNGILAERLSEIMEHGNVFALNKGEQLTVEGAARILDFCAYSEMWEDEEGELFRFIKSYEEQSDCAISLSKAAGWDLEMTKEVIREFCTDQDNLTNIVTFLNQISGAVYLLTKAALSVSNVHTLFKIIETGYTDYKTAETLSTDLTGGFFSERAFAELEAEKRDALLPVTLSQLKNRFPDITNYNKLYKFFLIDVEMDDKTKISPVKEAIHALQLYLQRCRMHLESGIREVSITDSWWEWMMDYTKWEANRKVFIYPENYLLPAVRHTKTSLFKEVESALDQARITEGYTEELYIKYLDSYFDLTQLKICGAYETIENYRDILYVFARTKQKPYTYYYSRRAGTLAWSEWEKIDCTIDSDIINPVYVFDRLYIFWSSVIEKEKVKLGNTGELSADNQRAYSLQIKYTYKNLQDKWITPQTLVEDETIYAQETGVKAETAKKISDRLGIYHKSESFRKLTLLKLNWKNLKGVPKKTEDYECLAVITGSFTQNLGENIKEINTDFHLDKEQEAFTKRLNQFIKNNNFQVKNREDGYMNTGFFKIYNDELEEEHFFHEKEFAVVDGYLPTRNSRMYNMYYDKIHHAVGIYLSQSVLCDGALPTEGILPFKNNTDIGEKPVLTKESFILTRADGTSIISEKVSEQIYDALVIVGLISHKTGRVDELMLANVDMREYLGKILEDSQQNADESNQMLEIQKVLLGNVGAVYLFEKAERAEIIPVVNRPGKFIYDCGDEAFLIYPLYEKEGEYYPVKIRKVDEGTFVGNSINVNTFVKMGMEQGSANHIMDELFDYGLADRENGVVDMDGCTRQNLGAALENVVISDVDREVFIDKIYGRILNLPLISQKVFDGIKNLAAADICKMLMNSSVKILYPWDETNCFYRVDLRQMKNKKDFILRDSKGTTVTEKVQEAVFASLTQEVSGIHFHYQVNQDMPEVFTDQFFSQWKFGVQRLTNPTIKKLKRKLQISGLKSFLNRETQSEPKTPVMPFKRLGPTDNVVAPKALDGAQIDFEGLYAEYNWELFYHIPIMIAGSLNNNSMHDDSMKWLHYVFNPTKTPDDTLPQYYWNFMPFVQTKEERLEQILTDDAAIQAYNDSPFDPHAIARLRIDSYAKYTVMEYVSNLIKWGDECFVRNTWESLVSATMMYVWAQDLLGPKPEEVRGDRQRADKCFREIEEYYAHDKEGIPQFILELEKKLQECKKDNMAVTLREDVPYNDIRSYFGVPMNEQFLCMWELVEDRLFKIRNSLDINGATRVTLLFEPPKDPLVLAKQVPVSAQDVPGTIGYRGTCYPYRFAYMIEQAKAAVSQLIQLGTSLNGALEKQDSETLMVLTQSQEQAVIKLGIAVREAQKEEIEKEVEALLTSQKSAQLRKEYYETHMNEYISDKEQTAIALSDEAASLHALGGITNFAAGVAHLLPQVGSPFAMKFGGLEVGESLRAMAAGYDTAGGILMHISQQTLTMAQYDRRKEEWELQLGQAKQEIEMLTKQIEAAKLRQKAAEMDLNIQKKTAEHKAEVMKYLKDKFTSVQLYQWMTGRLQSAMWQTYQLALELSMAAQEGYQYEQDEEADFLKFDYWDSKRKGLLSGEGLMLALQQMEQSFHKKNYRRLEIEKHISMSQTFPEALQQLKDKGSCEFELEEKLFAADYPGCYLRKIAEVTLSIPALLPPYETVKATLKQLKSLLLTKPDTKGINYLFRLSADIPNSVKDCGRYGEKIAVSKGIDDGGLFVLSFQDERYLPFEGTGAASRWEFEMPRECNNFDLESVRDIMITIRYTAKEDEKRGSQSFYEYVKKLCMKEGR